MRKKTKFFGLVAIALAMSSCGLFSCTPAEVTVKEDDDGEWRLYDDEGTNQGSWTVDEGTQITWKVTGSDMIFSFPTNMATYFEFSEDLFTEVDSMYTGPEDDPRRIQKIEEGESLSLMVKKMAKGDELEMRETAMNDTIDYDIYVIDAEKYVIGNSPPYLIIRRSHNR